MTYFDVIMKSCWIYSQIQFHNFSIKAKNTQMVGVWQNQEVGKRSLGKHILIILNNNVIHC